VVLTAVAALAACTPGTGGSGPTIPPRHRVAILVVDDFGGGHQDQTTEFQPTDNCAASTNEVGSDGVNDGALPAGVSHGEVVYDTVTAALNQKKLNYQHTAQGDLWTDPNLGSNYPVQLVKLHTYHYRTSDIINDLATTIERLSNEGYDRFVVNLSFVVFPCDIAKWLMPDSTDGQQLARYDSILGADPGLSQLKNYLKSYVSNETGPRLWQEILMDPRFAQLIPVLVRMFYAYVNTGFDPGTSFASGTALDSVRQDPAWKDFIGHFHDVVAVGAAGNGLVENGVRTITHFPFAPALWDSVLSVSANSEGRLASYSNWGEIAADGSFRATIQSSGSPLSVPISVNLRGTSFAAPRISAEEAIYLLHGGSISCNGTSPPGKYQTNWANFNPSTPYQPPSLYRECPDKDFM
jgi:hypothetical protein